MAKCGKGKQIIVMRANNKIVYKTSRRTKINKFRPKFVVIVCPHVLQQRFR